MDELAKRFAALAEQYGPKVYDAAMSATRVEAYSIIASGFLLIGMGVPLLWCSKYLWNKWRVEQWDDITCMPMAISGIAGAILICIGVWHFIDPWTWTAINQPELWIAKKIFRL